MKEYTYRGTGKLLHPSLEPSSRSVRRSRRCSQSGLASTASPHTSRTQLRSCSRCRRSQWSSSPEPSTTSDDVVNHRNSDHVGRLTLNLQSTLPMSSIVYVIHGALEPGSGRPREAVCAAGGAHQRHRRRGRRAPDSAKLRDALKLAPSTYIWPSGYGPRPGADAPDTSMKNSR